MFQSSHWLFMLTSAASFLGLIGLCVFAFIWAIVARKNRRMASNMVMAGSTLILFSLVVSVVSNFVVARFFSPQDVLSYMAVGQMISIPTNLLGMFCLIYAALGAKEDRAQEFSGYVAGTPPTAPGAPDHRNPYRS